MALWAGVPEYTGALLLSGTRVTKVAAAAVVLVTAALAVISRARRRITSDAGTVRWRRR